MSLKVSRVQELEADAAAARITSPEVATSALREVNVLAAVWSFYMGNFVGPAVAGFVRPIGIVHGFREVLHEPDRVDLLAQVRAEDPVELPSKFDSHPTFAQRAAALAKLPQGSGSTPDTRPAAALLQGADEVLEQASTAFLADNVRELKSKPWPEVAAEAGQVRTHEVAVMVSRLVREPLNGGIPTVADLLDQLSEPGDLAARFAKSIEQSEGYALPPEAHREALVEAVDGYLSWMAVATERLSWRLDWGRVTVLVDPAGSEVDFEPLLRAVVIESAPVDDLRARLVELGVQLSAGMRSGVVHLGDVAS